MTITIRKKPGDPGTGVYPPFKVKPGESLEIEFPEAPGAQITFNQNSPFDDPAPDVPATLPLARTATKKGHFTYTVNWKGTPPGVGNGSGDVG
jgi:hypothetical protein